MKRISILIPAAALIFLAMNFLSDEKLDAANSSSPRAIQYQETINRLSSLGGGKISETCRVSLKHTVLVTCQVSGVSIISVQNYLPTDGWLKLTEDEPKTVKYKKGNDFLTIHNTDGPFVLSLSLRAEK